MCYLYVIVWAFAKYLAPIFQLMIEHMEFVELIMKQKDLKMALKANLEATEALEKGLENLAAASEFFEQLKSEMRCGSYRRATIRMDSRYVSTRVMDDAPDCELDIKLSTTSWKKKLNMTMATSDKLLFELQHAQRILREDQANKLEENNK
ncbi:Protein CBG07745 [Caenorhabditis briggsae]|uniref:Protein CBG07745 n=1 Tax=Caenorhabditis briggsae TaxID=6238 RepID=A8X463_CAEBR|nr:Protein CBG07745 [Caenorhabditis briggsae]CAP27423.2 Protein CBG07745 [Caenorhabditis briggsae]